MKISVIGNGNWGTTVAKIIAENISKHSEFDKIIMLWTYEEYYNDKKLSEYINEYHENPIYLKGIKLPKEVYSVTELKKLEEVDIFVFCLPHQYINVLDDIKFKKDAFGINLSKGLIFHGENLNCISEFISKKLKIPCSSLSGANIASKIALGQLSDTTIGSCNQCYNDYFIKMFKSSYFIPSIMPYSKAIEICGAIKNIMAISYGIVKGLNCGVNAESIIFRLALKEMVDFCSLFNAEVNLNESYFIGDFFVSCLSGRNSRFGEEKAKTNISIEEFEKKMDGQKLQGPDTSLIVIKWMKNNSIDLQKFPIIKTVYEICFENLSCEYLEILLKK